MCHPYTHTHTHTRTLDLLTYYPSHNRRRKLQSYTEPGFEGSSALLEGRRASTTESGLVGL